MPASISDNTLKYGGAYRSRSRIPVLSYLHPVNECSITRSSQPLLGLRGHRSPQDEKLVSAIFSTSKSHNSDSRDPFISIPAGGGQSRVSSYSQTPSLSTQSSSNNLEAIEDATIARARNKTPDSDDETEDPGPRLYGAQQHNLIVDARPTINAMAMQAAGMGSENMDHYPFATKAYLGIDNIHVMRDSLNKVVDALKDSDVTPLPPNRDALASSGWLKHIANMMDGAALIARQVGIHHSHVLIHCSDGWDRTGQLSALSQLCLDPYYRTIEGFIVLVEKDFVSLVTSFVFAPGSSVVKNGSRWKAIVWAEIALSLVIHRLAAVGAAATLLATHSRVPKASSTNRDPGMIVEKILQRRHWRNLTQQRRPEALGAGPLQMKTFRMKQYRSKSERLVRFSTNFSTPPISYSINIPPVSNLTNDS